MSVDQIEKRIRELSSVPTQILFTGGEPLEGESRQVCIELAERLSHRRDETQYPFPRVETNGKESLKGLPNMVFTMDYKLPGSGMEEQMNLENFEILKNRNNLLDEIKFVIRDRQDFERAKQIIHAHSLHSNLLFSPVAGECSAEELVDWMKEEIIPGGRLSLQIHKVIWGDQRGV